MIEEPRAHRNSGHETLDAEIAEWRTWWSELSEFGQPRIGEMASRLERFREHLSDHFDAEESGLFASLAAQGHRGVSDDITTLRHEHRALLSDLDGLLGRFHSSAPEICCWGEAGREFESFLDRLQDHEQRENALQHRLLGASPRTSV